MGSDLGPLTEAHEVIRSALFTQSCLSYSDCAAVADAAVRALDREGLLAPMPNQTSPEAPRG